ncbi:hypothetical protein ACQZV8_19635 [Magnetococcales bacterium HHB-1]
MGKGKEKKTGRSSQAYNITYIIIGFEKENRRDFYQSFIVNDQGDVNGLEWG